MLKSVAFMPRRADLTRQAFRQHYEHRHAPLAVGFFPFRRYVRNHLQEAEPFAGFDCYSEFWVEDFAGIAHLLEGEVGVTMRADERRFTDQPRIVSALAEETLLAGPVRHTPEDGDQRLLCLLRREGAAEEIALQEALRRWAVGARRLTLDRLQPFRPEGTLPADAVASLWPAGGASIAPPALPPGWRVIGCCRATTTEKVAPLDAD